MSIHLKEAERITQDHRAADGNSPWDTPFHGDGLMANACAKWTWTCPVIERKFVRFLLRKKLNRKFPLGEIARRDGLEHIAAVEGHDASINGTTLILRRRNGETLDGWSADDRLTGDFVAALLAHDRARL